MNFITDKLQRGILVSMVAFSLSLGVLFTVPVQQVQAQSASQAEMIAMVNQLMATIAALQAQLDQQSGSVVVSSQVSIGSTVRTTDNLSVRVSPGGALVTVVGAGTEGVVTEGPRSLDGRTWWKIDYQGGPSGWSAANWLRVVSSQTVPVVPEEDEDEENEEDEKDEDFVTLRSSSNNPDAITVQLSDSGETRVTPFAFMIDAKDSAVDVRLGRLSINAEFDYEDGKVGIANANLRAPNMGFNYVADDVLKEGEGQYLLSFYLNDKVIPAGESLELVLDVGFEKPSAGFSTAEVEFTAWAGDLRSNVEDYGTVQSEEHTLLLSGLQFDLTDTEESLENGADDQGDYQLEFDLTAIGEDMFIPNTVSNSLSNSGKGFYFHFYNSNGSPETDGWTWAADVNSSADEDGGYYVVQEGDTESFTLSVSGTPEESGTYAVAIAAIKYYYGGPRQGSVKTLGLGNTHRTNYLVIDSGDQIDSSAIEATILAIIAQMKISTFNTSPSVVELSEQGFLLAEQLGGAKGDDYTDAIEDLLEDVIEDLAPQKNTFSCDRNGNDSYANGKVACYGMWDYGNSFGGDKNMCETDEDEGRTGCQIETSVCSSGTAEATSYHSNRSISSLSYTKIKEISSNLQTYDLIVKEEIAGLWEYSCVGPVVSIEPPEKNHYACSREGASDQDVACYGMWDYGNAFGGDRNMCDGYNGGTGCQVATTLCSSGLAEAITYYSNRQLQSLSNAKVATIASNLKTSSVVAREEIAGLWEYSCTTGQVLGASTSSEESVMMETLRKIQQILNGLRG